MSDKNPASKDDLISRARALDKRVGAAEFHVLLDLTRNIQKGSLIDGARCNGMAQLLAHEVG